MAKHKSFCNVVLVCCVVFLFIGVEAARADQINVTAAITSFSGNVLGQNQTFFQYCPANSCGVVGAPPPLNPTCPDAGCSVVQGIANVSFGGDPTRDTVNQLSFFVGSATQNGLSFSVAKGPGGFPLDVDPLNPFKLGTLTFTNGSWTGDANFGFTIVANDITTHTTHTFDGFIHLSLTPNSATNTPQQNADFVFLTDANGIPVVNPLTLLPLGSVRAYELSDSPNGSNTVSVDIFGQLGSLDLTSIENAQGGGFIDASITQDLAGPTAQTPEPATLALLGSGVLMIMAALKRRLL